MTYEIPIEEPEDNESPDEAVWDMTAWDVLSWTETEGETDDG